MEVMSMGTVIVLAIVAAAAALAIRSMIKDKKAGKSIQCGGDCSRCRSNGLDRYRNTWKRIASSRYSEKEEITNMITASFFFFNSLPI